MSSERDDDPVLSEIQKRISDLEREIDKLRDVIRDQRNPTDGHTGKLNE